MSGNSSNIVNGYCFGTSEDAEVARQELKKIEYLEQHMDYGKTENMLLVYKKAVEGRIFRTPIGWEYLKKLQKELSGRKDLKEEIPPVPLDVVFGKKAVAAAQEPVPSRQMPKGKDNMKKPFITSLIINAILVAAVAAMFYIALTSDNPNIINYENNLQNKYAQWEQELSERENAVREKERNLMIEE